MINRCGRYGGWLLLWFLALPAAAEQPTEAAVIAETPYKLLILFLVLCCVVGYVLLKRGNFMGLNVNAKSGITVEQQYLLTARDKILILNVAGDRYLVGVTQSQINLLDKLEPSRALATSELTPRPATEHVSVSPGR